VFDVEVAFFFPWAIVFGKANQLANMPPIPMEARANADLEKSGLSPSARAIEEQRRKLSKELLPSGLSQQEKHDRKLAVFELDEEATKKAGQPVYKTVEPKKSEEGEQKGKPEFKQNVNPIRPEDAATWAQIAFWDLMAFFAILLVGFAYVWRRGDIDWVRAYSAHKEPAMAPEKPLEERTIDYKG
jgi:NADH-quinone oxidoreductase subunit A